ncbi:Nuclear import and export protein Msn5 [Rasamsonia emersonii CBS 393.64]|uniref:Nuclear import and export protein Msn5 n=1 Tax=Rasamsonia emersonii (strain ATCC 16479 / CBS 393.64 / IMI 116815) TaxID=1408163 RepID=A0A0F4YPV1_RASE3|nr:Nuclear import and export protein Msn5 [Rasamsonia emersonii CBS 393.64]KKA20307.1 Nuclear import and export protein Msn5 [Rasamsonia emersonii CBS 393.64]
MATNGLSEGGMADIIRALELSHDPTSSNELRRQALHFLESQKQGDAAARNGFLLASQADNSPLVRHFGLSLLDHVLCHTGFMLSSEQISELKDMVLQLAESIRPEDPNYYRNKIAQLWAEVAKRSWGIDWLGMDESLVKLWNASVLHKEFVLTVLETLSEDIFYREDTVSSLRGTDLNRALVEIFTPLSVFEEVYPERDHRVELRCGNEGWLSRTCDFLNSCLENLQTSREAKECSLKALAVLRSVLVWSIPKAVIACHAVATLCRTLTTQIDQVLLAAVEALHSLYSRSSYEIDEFQPLILLMYQTDHLTLFRKLFEWSNVEATDIDETRYAVAKKLSETPVKLKEGAYGIDMPLFFQFLLEILRHQSLTVSIPVLHSWSRLLVSERIGDMEVVTGLIAPLLEICTQRLVRWESLPEDSEDPTVLFLNEDIDTIPERHAFVGNYRRYCSAVIEIIVQKRPHDAIPHILAGVDQILNNLYSGVQPFSVESFKKSSIPLMRADTQFSVVEATLKGYNKWVTVHGRMPQQDEHQRRELENILETWALSLMQRTFEDPVIKQRVIRLIVDISSRALDKSSSFALKVLEHILMTHVEDQPQYPAYSEAVKELNSLASHELRRLSMRYADYFFTFYDVLEPKIREIAAAHQTDDKLQTELNSVLLIITQRASNVDPYIRETRLQAFVEPIRQAWQNEEFKRISSSFSGFCQMLGVERVGPYMQAKQAHKIEDWSTVPLDEEGKRIQEEMSAKFQLLPLRATKTLLAVSTEKLKRTEPAYELACGLWRDIIPTILPTLLQLVSHAHAFHNPANWGDLSDDMQAVVGRILTDRFWQAGISSGSRDDFYAKIAESRSSLEGFASSVRGKVRAVRETCYSMLFSMSRLREYFYGFEELPVPLSEALFKDSTHLSSHQFSILLNISRCLIDDCPVRFRSQFLPPMLSTLFTQIDKKVTNEWDSIERRKAGLVDGDLTEEMKDESILRQLTYSAVVMVASLLDPQRGDPDEAETSDPSVPPPPPSLSDSMRHFVLSNPPILEPVILFCTHVLRMRDTRCCSIITRVIRSILQDFAPPLNTPTAVTIREFISSEVLRACITSVHEPYFVDMQKDLAQLISSIWILYGPSTSTPRSVMLSLPGMSEARVANTEIALMRSTSARQQRALILDLLDGLRGVSIAEQGKILGSREERRKARSAMQARYMTNEMEGQEKTGPSKVDIDDGPDLGGVADMFG